LSVTNRTASSLNSRLYDPLPLSAICHTSWAYFNKPFGVSTILGQGQGDGAKERKEQEREKGGRNWLLPLFP